MKHFFILLICCSNCFSTAYCNEKLINTDVFNKSVEEDLCFDDEGKATYYFRANFFEVYFDPSKKYAETSIIDYTKTNITSMHCHVGWYSNGYIMTIIQGQEEGKQVVFHNGIIIGIAYPDKKNYCGITTHTYSWGTVHTSDRFQEVYFL